MAVPEPAHAFLIRLADGRTWGAVEFPNGFVCVHHPDEITVCTIATSLDGLLTDLPPGHPLHGAKTEDYG